MATNERLESAPLGIYAKCSPSPANRGMQTGQKKIDPETGEILDDVKDPAIARIERFILQSAARRIMHGNEKIKRIAACLRLRHKGAQVSVHKSKAHGSAHYGGLQTCGSVWVCSCCAAKISERRRVELMRAVEIHKQGGGDVLLLTLTNPHHLGDKLKDVLEGQRKALEFFNKGGDVTRHNLSIGYIGQVRALEVTHGRKRTVNNGWHPHYHLLLFVDAGLNLIELRRTYYEKWSKSCTRAGLKVPDYEHGITLEDGSKAAKYASKWGIESELTKGHTKKAKDGETPFDFLRAFVQDKNDRQAAALFKEFAEVFKGKSQLFWSRGLKKHFRIDEETDEEIAASQADNADLLGNIEFEEWMVILKHEKRGDVLELARSGGWWAVQVFIEQLMNDEFQGG